VTGCYEHGYEPSGSIKGGDLSTSRMAVSFPRGFLLHIQS
jgi:hypothetical protein